MVAGGCSGGLGHGLGGGFGGMAQVVGLDGVSQVVATRLVEWWRLWTS